MLGVLDVETAGDLRRLGSDLAFRMLRDIRMDTSVDLSAEERKELKRLLED